MKKECERHPLIGIECSGDAKFILYRHNTTVLICSAFARYIWAIGTRTRCYECRGRRRIVDCWTTEQIR